MRTVPTIPSSTARAVKLIQRGLHWREAEALAAMLGVTLERLASLIAVSPATLYRRKKARRFSPMESDRLMRFARLWRLSVEVFESEEGARRWLEAPQVTLGGAIPLDYSATETGVRDVEALLHRIDRGILA
jgi:putative toxin-antitoxin system antitoxin component (TIGR02293 family)